MRNYITPFQESVTRFRNIVEEVGYESAMAMLSVVNDVLSHCQTGREKYFVLMLLTMTTSQLPDIPEIPVSAVSEHD